MIVHLRRKKNKSGNVYLYLEYSVSGEAVKEYLGINVTRSRDNYKENMLLGEKIRNQREQDILHGKFQMAVPYKKKADLIKYFSDFNKNYKKKNYKTFAATLKCLIAFAGETLPASRVNETFCAGFLEYLREREFTPSSRETYFGAFRKILRQAVKSGIFQSNPASEILNKNEDAGKLLKEALDVREVNKLVRTPCRIAEVKRAYLVSCNTGLRGVDARALYWREVKSPQRMIIFDQAKTSGQNFLPLNKKAIQLLGKPGKPGEKVFNLPSIRVTNEVILKWVEKAGIQKHITFHCGRHSCASNLIAKGVHLKTVSLLLGHKTTKHTEKYSHISDKLRRQAVDSL